MLSGYSRRPKEGEFLCGAIEYRCLFSAGSILLASGIRVYSRNSKEVRGFARGNGS